MDEVTKGEKKYYPEILGDRIKAYHDDPGVDSFGEVLCCLFHGIVNNYSLPCPAMPAKDGSLIPARVKNKYGRQTMVLLTELDGGSYPTVADVKVRALVRCMLGEESDDGFIFNPGTDRFFFVSKSLLAYALDAGYEMAMEDMKEQDADSTESRR